MCKARTWVLGALSVFWLGCEPASVRRLTTPYGAAVEVRCSDPAVCRSELTKLSCPPGGAKTLQPISDYQFVVTCQPVQQATTQVTPNTRDPLSERGPQRRIYIPTDPFARGGTQTKAVRITATMQSAAARVAQFEKRAAEQLVSMRKELAHRCRAGSVEDCVAELDLTPWSALPEQGPAPTEQLRALDSRTRTLLGLCQHRQPAACHRLGELVYVMGSSGLLPALSTSAHLPTTLQQALVTDPQFRAASPALIARVVQALKGERRLKATTVEQWSRACKQGSPAACLLGASVGWQEPPTGEAKPVDELSPEQVAERPTALVLQRHCQAQSSLCALSRQHELSAGLIAPPAYCSDLREWCSQDDPTACEQLASAIVNHTCRAADRNEGVKILYQKACAQGSARACLALVQPSLAAGAPMLALAYALQSCQKQFSAGCQVLSERFGRSRRYSDNEAGLEILAHACQQEYLPACHDVYVSQYLRGNAELARQNLTRLCLDSQQLDACRTTAQLDWLSGELSTARQHLERLCQATLGDSRSCIELASLLAQQGERQKALGLLVRQCRTGGALAASACSRARLLEEGTTPQTLADVFLEPIASGDLCDSKLLPWYANDDPLRLSGLECLR